MGSNPTPLINVFAYPQDILDALFLVAGDASDALRWGPIVGLAGKDEHRKWRHMRGKWEVCDTTDMQCFSLICQGVP